ncbi:ABC transporter ATP-binding protein [Tissierella carlieri]|jgi:NitT/TauT family transport system ATP-binding protein|uniref:ABC transporter ATP-binding protein n=1 Tax=Tissierella carlieri TaxID=689904 RepID=A0ABT1S9A0_9FIRM|nr:ABC transporter ATP-binding protein [Tissierella carlieri]MBU5312531.1 ABC transporter ATP-binding protein [Tissierella carlieri]MCQ4922920.1 ABC transporter ATP-binding protein [Tissierella carlieri]MDU5081744.1 ABC transporter ATP-binding protein [Bacillota bacterium]
MDEKIIVEIKNIGMTYHSLEGETVAIKNIDLNILEGEIVGIVGPSGCGKSTLLSIIAGLIQPSTGSVLINGKKVTKSNRNIGYMFQKDQLLEWRTIMQNVILGLEIQGKLTPEDYKAAKEMLENYGLGDFINSYPSQLSGGMRQRVALIRTLLLEPDLLLLDEPFSALDYQTRLAIADEIGIILKREKKTGLLITHDIAEAISLSDRVVILSKRPAHIKEIIDINLTCPDGCRTPLKCREAPEFRHYFNKIWKELDVHV